MKLPLLPFDLHALEFALRAGLVTLMLFVAAVVLREHLRSLPARLAAALAVGVAAYALQSAPGFQSWPAAWRAPQAALSTGNAVVFWLFSRALFDDEFRWRPAHALAWGAMAVVAVVGCFAKPLVGLVIPLATLGFSLLALAQSLSSWRADLVEKRRRLRVFIVGAGALYTLVNMGSRLLSGGGAGELARIADLLALSAIALVVAWHLVRPSGVQLFWPEAPQPVAPDTPLEEPLDAGLVAALERLMTSERVYRQEGVSVAVLARRLGLPEYKLRRVINQGLGYRNFNAFLNRYRINEVKAALADPAQAPVPVLTLAMDAGFQSLGPFNRAFKAETGLTPTEFRRAQAG
ncbi:MAG: helix-turn-helix domain-containing protein [Rhizobacter sp.]